MTCALSNSTGGGVCGLRLPCWDECLCFLHCLVYWVWWQEGHLVCNNWRHKKLFSWTHGGRRPRWNRGQPRFSCEMMLCQLFWRIFLLGLHICWAYRPVDGARAERYYVLSCPSLCACVRAMAKQFSGRLLVNFSRLLPGRCSAFGPPSSFWVGRRSSIVGDPDDLHLARMTGR